MSIDSEPEIIFKWTNLCRLCLSSDSHIDLFSSEVTSQDCLSKIRSCLNLLVYYGDPMPAKLCLKCHLKLDEWCNFKKECIQAEANVKKRLQTYKDLKFVKEYFERCAKFESSEIVSSSSKSNNNFSEVNSSVSTQEYQEESCSQDNPAKYLTASGEDSETKEISETESCQQKPRPRPATRKISKVRQKPKNLEISGVAVKEEESEENNFKKEWGIGNESGALGTIVSVTGSASDIWDTNSYYKQADDIDYYFNKGDDKNKTNQYDYLQYKTCPNCGIEFNTEEEFDSHTCCMIGSSTNLDDENGHFEDSISLGSEYNGAEPFSTEYRNSDSGIVRSFDRVKITPWKCIACELYFTTSLDLRIHYSSGSCFGKKIKALSCEFCYRQFLTYNDLIEHQVVHLKIRIDLTEDDLICCNHCSLQFPDKRRFNNHTLLHALKRKTPIKYTCSTCSQVFFQKNLYENHLCTHAQMQNSSEDISESVEVAPSPSLEASTTMAQSEASSEDQPKKPRGAIRCFRCGQMFASVKQLQHHEAIKHKNPTPYVCRKCGLRFSARSQLLMHLRVHMSKSNAKNTAEEVPNACTVCDAKFLLESDLESHMKTHKLSSPEPPSPTDSQVPEETANNLELFAKYKCSLCSKLYVRANSCIRHGQQSHKGVKVVPLKLKRSVFLGRRSSLAPGGKEKHKCSKCPKYFFSFNAYRLHVYRSHGLKTPKSSENSGNLESEDTPGSPKSDEIESKCPFCSKDIKPSYISLHIKKFHRGEVLDPSMIDKDIPIDSCICRYCLKTCSTPHNRKLHESIHYPVKAQRNQCETCGQKFSDKTQHEDHVRTCKSIRCGKCHKIFFKFINLAQHSCTGTKSDEVHKCTVCLSAFTSLDLLQIHIKNFHGKKPESSTPQPGTSKNSTKRLERVLWREESNKIVCMVGEKFYCTFCDCEFSTIQESNDHRAAHPRGNWYAVQISDSLFQCTICDKFFESRKSSLLHINYHKKSCMQEQSKQFQLSFEPEVEIFTDVKPTETPKNKKYNCRYCTAAFRDEEDLQEHLFYTHVNQT